MPSPVRQKSYGSVKAIWVDEQVLQHLLETLVARYRQRPEVLAVVLFGSLARGRFVPGSDIDLLLILEHSPLPFPDRLPHYLPADVPLDVQVFPYTWEEVRRGHPLAWEALTTGRLLWAREAFASVLRAHTEIPRTRR